MPSSDSHHRSPKKMWILSAVLSFLFLLILGGVLFFYFFFQITSIVLQKNDQDLNIRYPKIQKMMEIVKGNNLVLLSTDFLEKSLQIPFPELKSIHFTKKYPSTLELSVESYPIVAKWIYKKEGDARQFFGFLTENGYFLQKGNDDIFLMFDMQLRKKEIPFYGRLMSSDQVRQIMDVKWLLEDITKRKMVSLSYYQNAQEIRFLDEKKVEYWIFLQKPLAQQAEKLRTMLQTDNVYATPLEYIDLRIEKKVIYKPL